MLTPNSIPKQTIEGRKQEHGLKVNHGLALIGF